MTRDVKAYFRERYEKANFRVVPGHWPDFRDKAHVDEWMANMEIALKPLREEFPKVPPSKPDRCPFCGADAAKTVRNSFGNYFVLCRLEHGGCGARGAKRPTQESAVRAWNHRHFQFYEEE